jgi:hypothetical protein
MASILKRLACACAVLAAAAASASAQSAADRVSFGEIELQALKSQKLTPGRCSLFLWSKTERPVFVLFATEDPAQALVKIDGREYRMSRKTASGDAIFGHYEKQSFVGGKFRFDLDLTYERNDKVQDGAIIERGVLRSRDKAGFETILPVGGMIGCQKA